MTNVSVSYTLGSEAFGCNGLLSTDSIIAYSTVLQQIVLPQDWFIFSTYVSPENPDISSLFSELVDNTTIVKNYAGQVYWPMFNINSIGSLTDGQGYYVKMIEEDTLEIEGNKISNDFSINMPGDWFITAYLHESPANAIDMMAPIVDDLIIVKSYTGNVYWPLFGINSLGDMQPGWGYYVKTGDPISLVYPGLGNSRLGFGENEFMSMNYDKPLNTGNNMTLGIPGDIWLNQPTEGDEIVIVDQNNIIAGNGPYRIEGSVVTIWGDDDLTDKKDGLYIGEQFIIKLWRNNESIEEIIVVDSWQEGNGNYSINSISIPASLSQNIVQEKKLIKVTDILGRDIDINSKKSTLLYIYDDGSIEKKYILK